MNICFNISIEYSDFGSYLNFELIKLNENSGSNIKDEDYAIEYHFNGNYKKSISFKKKKKKLTDTIKSDNDVKKFCNFTVQTKTPIYKNIYFILSIIFTIAFIVLLFILIKKFRKTNDFDIKLTSSNNQIEKELVPK